MTTEHIIYGTVSHSLIILLTFTGQSSLSGIVWSQKFTFVFYLYWGNHTFGMKSLRYRGFGVSQGQTLDGAINLKCNPVMSG